MSRNAQTRIAIPHTATKKIEEIPSLTREYILESFEPVTYSTAAAGFAGIALFQLIAAAFAIYSGTASDAMSNALGSSVCMIAALHYQYMRANRSNLVVVLATRYSDWYITTILMLIEFFNLAGTLTTQWGWLIGACLSCESMILSGHVATYLKVNNQPFQAAYLISIVFGIILSACYIFGTFVSKKNDENNWMHVFAAPWILYPIAFWAEEYRHVVYNILDLYAKGIFGLVLGIITFV